MYYPTTGENGRCAGSCCCTKGYKWFVQIMVILALIYLIISLALSIATNYIVYVAAIIIFIIYMLIYSIMGCCSNTCAYLKNIRGGGNVCDYMERIFYTPGCLTCYAECYHYVVTYSRRGGSSRRKVVTYTETRTFPYQSWRDISGPFNLDTSGAENRNLPLLKLELNKSVELAQDGSVNDYTFFRDSMIYRLQYVDHYFNLIESSTISGFNDKTLVKVGDEIPVMQ